MSRRISKKKGGGCYDDFFPSKEYVCPSSDSYAVHK